MTKKNYMILYSGNKNGKHEFGTEFYVNRWILDNIIDFESRLGGVMVSVLATGPKVCGFEPGQGDGFFKSNKNWQHTFLLDGK
jgi:hypothetical protein